ncbi:hypothetical protein U1Q18_039127 [Sarracenia purpurea var. burkii]
MKSTKSMNSGDQKANSSKDIKNQIQIRLPQLSKRFRGVKSRNLKLCENQLSSSNRLSSEPQPNLRIYIHNVR